MDKKNLQHNLRLQTRRNLWIFAGLSVLLLALLAMAPMRDYFSEWRAIQGQYNEIQMARGKNPTTVEVKQIWIPELGITDRCTTCHLGMGDDEAIPGHKLFGAHPATPHDASDMGCTLCHSGQGRATKTAEAHGGVKYWEAPMIPVKYSEASCGACHTHLNAPVDAKTKKGEELFVYHGCQSCHIVNGEGGDVGPDLSWVALKGYDREWQVKHLKDPGAVVEGSRMMNFGHLQDDELDAIVHYLESLVGAPKFVEARKFALQSGCRSCHFMRGLGGKWGPKLTNTGAKSSEAYDYTHVKGKHNPATWLFEHFKDPQAVDPKSQMINSNFSDEEAKKLTLYMFSLREDIPDKLYANNALVQRLTGAREFGSSAKAAYDHLCATCHGKNGEGRDIPSMETTVPSLNNIDFLSIASDDYIQQSIISGRSGRPMPSWGAKETGLTQEEAKKILKYIRSWEPKAPTFAEVMQAPIDLKFGQNLFASKCSACHGNDGIGTEIAPSLHNDEFLSIADDHFLYKTIAEGRLNSAMPAHKDLKAGEFRSLIGAIRSWQQGPSIDVSFYKADGSMPQGRKIFAAMCASCHGTEGEGGIGPALHNDGFLAQASDGFIAESIRNGRGLRGMLPLKKGGQGFVELNDSEINDVTTFIRSWQGTLPGRILSNHVQGDTIAGEGIYQSSCSGCHGFNGAGKSAPALNNPEFLSQATDGFLQATLIRGRHGRAMRAWSIEGQGIRGLTPKEMNNVVAYIRSWQ